MRAFIFKNAITTKQVKRVKIQFDVRNVGDRIIELFWLKLNFASLQMNS